MLSCALALVFGVLVKAQYDDFGGGFGGGFDGLDYDDPYGMDPYGMDPYGMDYGGFGGMPGMPGMDMGPPFAALKDSDDVKAFPAKDLLTPAVIAFIDEDANSEDLSEFKIAAMDLSRSDIRVGLVTDVTVLEELKYSGTRVNAYMPEKLVKEKADRPRSRYPGKHLDSSSLALWAWKATTPSVGLLTLDSASRYQGIGLPEVTLFTKVDLEGNAKGYEYFASRLRKVAEVYGKKLVFNIADSTTMAHRISSHKIKLGEEPAAAGVGIRSGSKYYRMDAPFSSEAVGKFCEDFLAGTLAFVHVEVAPEPGLGSLGGMGEEADDVDDSDVVKLTSANFAKEINDKSVDSIVEFYAPWCGHCKHLKPEFAALAKKVKDVGTVKVAAMDATAHDAPQEFAVEGFPTLYFVKGGDTKNAVLYNGARTADAMLAFIKEHASVAFEA